MRHVLLVMTDPVEGKEDEYNTWYDEVHLREVLQVPGIVAAQRFSAAPAMPGRDGPPRRYLAIYEIESEDLAGTLAALSRAAPNMDISPAIDTTSAVAYPFTAHGPRLTARIPPG